MSLLFIDWRTRLQSAEAEIEAAGEDFNYAVREQNRMLTAFPLSLFAGPLGFEKVEALELSALSARPNQPVTGAVPVAAAVWSDDSANSAATPRIPVPPAIPTPPAPPRAPVPPAVPTIVRGSGR